eukprot:COSAG01_NODE_4335_length_5127_cov_4.593278_7_plen_86_part_01
MPLARATAEYSTAKTTSDPPPRQLETWPAASKVATAPTGLSALSASSSATIDVVIGNMSSIPGSGSGAGLMPRKVAKSRGWGLPSR